jgi:hypothetical protein
MEDRVANESATMQWVTRDREARPSDDVGGVVAAYGPTDVEVAGPLPAP